MHALLGARTTRARVSARVRRAAAAKRTDDWLREAAHACRKKEEEQQRKELGGQKERKSFPRAINDSIPPNYEDRTLNKLSTHF